ncbi:MAG: flagellar hook-length control protein FliK [Rhizobiaceae bacterium]
MSSDQIVFGAFRNIDVPTKGNNKDDKTQLKFEGLVSKGKHSVEEKMSNLHETKVSLSQATKGQTAKSRYSADANKIFEQEALADNNGDSEKQLESIADLKSGIIDVRSSWRSHAGVAHPNVDFSGNLTEHKIDAAAEQPRDLPSKIDAGLHKFFGKPGPVISAATDGKLPIPENTVVLPNGLPFEQIAPHRTAKLPIGNAGQTAEELHGLNRRNVARSEPADRTGEPRERWNIQKPAIEASTGKSMNGELNVQQGAAAGLRGLGLTDKLSVPLDPRGERKLNAEPVPIKPDRPPDPGPIRDGRLHSDMKVTVPTAEKAELNTRFDTHSLRVSSAKSDEISGAPPNPTDILKSQFAGANQPGGIYRSTISSQATTSLLAVIEANSNWSSQLKALATATVAKQDRNGVGPQTLRIQLHPAELGVMDATLRISGDRLHLNLSVEQDSTLRSLLRDSQAIHNALRASGFHVDELTITGTSQQDDLSTNERAFANGNAAQEETEDGERSVRKQLQGEGDANDQASNELIQESDTDGLYI